MKYIYTLFFLLVILCKSNAALCLSLGNGDWTNPLNWSCGSVPTCGDSVVIQTAHTVTISSQQNYTGCSGKLMITIYGRLKFTNGNKLRLNCVSGIYLMPGGVIDPGTGGGNSNTIEICGDIYWNAASGTLTGPGCLPPWLPGCATVLPIELISFEGKVEKSNVLLEWLTANEINNNYFLLKRSKDLENFTQLTKVNANQKIINSKGQNYYSYNDTDPENGVSYYTLEQYDLDLKMKLRKTISVNVSKNNSTVFTIFPNPNKGEFTLSFDGLGNNHKVDIQLIDQKGKLVYSDYFYTSEITKEFSIVPTTKLANGIYICNLFLEGIKYSVKVVVE